MLYTCLANQDFDSNSEQKNGQFMGGTIRVGGNGLLVS